MTSNANHSVTLAEAESRLAALIDLAANTGRPVELTADGHKSAVLMSADQHRELLATMEFMRDAAAGLADAAAKDTEAWDDVRDELLAKLDRMPPTATQARSA